MCFKEIAIFINWKFVAALCQASLSGPIFILFYFFCFLAPHLRHMDVPRLGVESEPQLPACTTATTTQDPSRVCDLHHSSQQCWIPDPLSEARDWTHILSDINQIRFCCATTGTPIGANFYFQKHLLILCLYVTFCHSCTISNFFIIVVVGVIYNQWSLILLRLF